MDTEQYEGKTIDFQTYGMQVMVDLCLGSFLQAAKKKYFCALDVYYRLRYKYCNL